MSKLDELRRSTAGNVDDSMGVGRKTTAHRPHVPVGPASTPARWQGVSKSRNVAEIPVGRIARDETQPREDFDEEAIRRLAESLRSRGQIQPISVRWNEGRGEYIIVCGERRWRAATLAEMATMSCVVLEDGPIAPGELLALQLVENLLREDLKPIEQAKAYRSLMDSKGWTVSQLARELAVDHSNVSRALAILATPPVVQELVEQGRLSPATAYEVSKLNDPAVQVEVAGRVVSEGLTRSDTAREVAERQANASATKGRRAKPKSRKATERTLRTPGGPKVTVEWKRGLDQGLVVLALEEALSMARAEG